jgi:hypothetical protein
MNALKQNLNTFAIGFVAAMVFDRLAPRSRVSDLMSTPKEPVRCPYADYAVDCWLDECGIDIGCWRIREEKRCFFTPSHKQ